MIRYKLDRNDYQFVEGQTEMSLDLDCEGGSQIEITYFSNEPLIVKLSHTDGDEMIVHVGMQLNAARYSTRNFDTLVIAGEASAKYGIKVTVNNCADKELNDGVPVIMRPLENSDLKLERAVQHTIIRELVAGGADRDFIEDLLTGLNENDEDLEFDDDVDVPSEAEMNDMIDQARIRAAEEPPEDVLEAEATPTPSKQPEPLSDEDSES